MWANNARSYIKQKDEIPHYEWEMFLVSVINYLNHYANVNVAEPPASYCKM